MRRPVGVKSDLFWLCGTLLFSLPSSHCRHASIRTLEERFVSLGACWAFSFQPVLPSVYRPVVLLFPSGTWARRLTQSPELGVLAFDFPFAEMFLFLGCDRQRTLLAVVQWFVRFSAHPQVMQQHRELSCGGNDGSTLAALSAPFGQFQSPAAQITIDTEWSQDVLRSLHQQRAQIGIALLADVHLRLALKDIVLNQQNMRWECEANTAEA